MLVSLLAKKPAFCGICLGLVIVDDQSQTYSRCYLNYYIDKHFQAFVFYSILENIEV